MSLVDRIAIVTGSGGGLGRAHARYLARQGAKVVVNDLSAAPADAVVAEIVADGGEAMAVTGSVTDEAAMAALVQAVLERWGRVDILVNNAGILRDKSFAKMTIEDFRAVVDVHLIGTAICSKAVWEPMRAQRYGRIVMTTSSSGLYGNFGQANYGAAKMAVVGLMQTLAIEGDKYGIRVNALAPTAATQMTDGVLSADVLSRLSPELVSPALLPLVSEDAPTRTILCAGGGHVGAAHVTLTDGYFVGAGDDAGEQIKRHWHDVTRRDGEAVPACGFFQAERELASSEAANQAA